MLQELIQFSNALGDDFKVKGLSPKEGLHILLSVNGEGKIQADLDSIQYEYYSKKMGKDDLSPLLEKCKRFQDNAWCINTNKCFDLPIKAIQTCSPICVGFKREHISGGKKFEANKIKGKTQIHNRFNLYFEKAITQLNENEQLNIAYDSFKDFFEKGEWEVVLNDILVKRKLLLESFVAKEIELKNQIKSTTDKAKKDLYDNELNRLNTKLLQNKALVDGDYILFYLDFPLIFYKETHGKYLDDRLFNTDKYNTKPNEEGLLFGTNDFMNGYNSNMPFLMHQTATFDITGRISNKDAKELYDFGKILPQKTLPNPLPIFIYSDEFNNKVIALYNDKKLAFKEIVKELYANHKDEFKNYYLLYWINTKNGIVFKDFDFISNFDYEFKAQIENRFKLSEKDKKGLKHYSQIKNVFGLEENVLQYLIQNKYHRADYFGDLKKDDYESRDFTFQSYCKYRKAIYDFVYKSRKNAINGQIFDEMVFNGIKDDFHNNNGYGVKEKLNIWYSLYEQFHNQNNNHTMASKLKEYHEFVTALTEGNTDTETCTDGHFAFAAGQVIKYILAKSKSDDTSYRLLEPYLQKSNCKALQYAISNDFERYKHENFSRNFEKVAAFVLSYETELKNIKDLQPQLLSGLFANNQLYSNQNKNQ